MSNGWTWQLLEFVKGLSINFVLYYCTTYDFVMSNVQREYDRRGWQQCSIRIQAILRNLKKSQKHNSKININTSRPLITFCDLINAGPDTTKPSLLWKIQTCFAYYVHEPWHVQFTMSLDMLSSILHRLSLRSDNSTIMIEWSSFRYGLFVLLLSQLRPPWPVLNCCNYIDVSRIAFYWNCVNWTIWVNPNPIPTTPSLFRLISMKINYSLRLKLIILY